MRVGTVHSTLAFPAEGAETGERKALEAARVGSRCGRRVVPSPATTSPELFRRPPLKAVQAEGAKGSDGAATEQAQGPRLRRRTPVGLSREDARVTRALTGRGQRRQSYGTLEMEVRAGW